MLNGRCITTPSLVIKLYRDVGVYQTLYAVGDFYEPAH
jgi:hypothetical protein